MMKITHIALYTDQLEIIKDFYCKWFGALSGAKYINSKTNFESYFLEFEQGGCKLEIMTKPGLGKQNQNMGTGLAHFAISVGTMANVDILTHKFAANGYKIMCNPRVTGDGYYESVISDPDGNLVEITV